MMGTEEGELTPEEKAQLKAIRARKKIIVARHRALKSTAGKRPLLPRRADQSRTSTTSHLRVRMPSLLDVESTSRDVFHAGDASGVSRRGCVVRVVAGLRRACHPGDASCVSPRGCVTCLQGTRHGSCRGCVAFQGAGCM